MVLGNTFHLFLAPGPRAGRAASAALHRFMRWDRPVITDSGGFQVFSMGHGTVADEIKGRAARGERAGAILGIEEEGVRFRSYVDGVERFMGPETSMEVQAALGSDIALVFDECTAVPRHARLHGALDRAHAPLARPLPGLARRSTARRGRRVYGIVQGGVEEDLRRWSGAGGRRAAATFGLAIGGSLGQDKPQMYEVVGWTTEELPEERPRHLLGIGDVDDLLRGVELGDRHVRLRDADAHRPPRHGARARPGAAAGASTSPRAATARPTSRSAPAARARACAAGYSRAYLHYLFRLGETTGARILTLHNLAYLRMLMAALRDAIDAGRLAEATGRGPRRRRRPGTPERR